MLTVRAYRSGAAVISMDGADGSISWRRDGGIGALLCSAIVAGGSIIALGGEDDGISLLSISASPEQGSLQLVDGQESTLISHTSFVTDLSSAGPLWRSHAAGTGDCHALVSCSLDRRVILWAIYPGEGIASSCVLQVVLVPYIQA